MRIFADMKRIGTSWLIHGFALLHMGVTLACTLAGIPCLDIIHYDAHNGTGFAHYWHTTHDDMQNISKTTLDAVGRTLMTLIQNEYARNN